MCTAKLLSGVTSGVCTGKCVARLREGNIECVLKSYSVV